MSHQLKVWAVMDVHQSEVFIQVGNIEHKIAVTVGASGAVRLLLANESHRFDLINHQAGAMATEDIVWILPVAEAQEGAEAKR